MNSRQILSGKYRVRDNDTHFSVFVDNGEIVQRFDIPSTDQSRNAFRVQSVDWFRLQIEKANEYHAAAMQECNRSVKKKLAAPSVWTRLFSWLVGKTTKNEARQ